MTDFSKLSDSQSRIFEERINHFEVAWFSQERPAIEHFLVTDDPLLRRVLIAELIHIEAELRTKAGEVVSIENYLERFPELSSDQSLLDSLGKVATATRSLLDYRGVDVADASTVNFPGDESHVDTPTAIRSHGGEDISAKPQHGLQRIGEYQILAEIARGGMGIVYKARHLKLGRLAAVKLLRSGEFADAEEIRRFFAEAEAAAQLDHPGIVPIFETGEHSGQQFIAMAYVEGQSLWNRVRERPFEPREAARMMIQVAEAVEYAHQRGIIHRDLKPQNVLLTTKGQSRVTDFGLAKITGGDSSLTATGQILGTPAYMPPEQASGRTDLIGPLSDVYSLGATLYCLLTGRPPFQAASTIETLQHVLERDPVAPRLLNPGVDLDLETICLKALAKEPSLRYASAAQFAADLGSYLAGEPILGRREGTLGRLRRKVRRNPVVATLLGLTVLALFGVALASVNNRHVRRVRDLERQVTEAVDGFDGSPERLEHAETTLRSLESQAPDTADTLRDSLQRKFRRLVEDRLKEPRLSDEDRRRIDESLVLIATRSPADHKDLLELRSRRYQAPELQIELQAPFERLDEIFPPGSVRVTPGGLLPVEPPTGNSKVRSSGEAALILTRISSFGDVQFDAEFDGDWSQGRSIGVSLFTEPARISCLAASPRGTQFATGSTDGRVFVHEADSGKLQFEFASGLTEISALAITLDEHFIAAASPSGQIAVCDLSTRKPVWNTKSGTVVNALTFSPDGSRLAAGLGAVHDQNAKGAVRLWSVLGGQSIFEWSTFPRGIGALAFSPDGKNLAVGCGDALTYFGELQPSPPTRKFSPELPVQAVSGVAFSPNGHLLASGGSNGIISLWRVQSGERVAELQGREAGTYGLCFSVDGRELAAGYDNHCVLLWDLKTFQRHGTLLSEARGRIDYVTFANQGSRCVLLSSHDGIVRLWDPATERELSAAMRSELRFTLSAGMGTSVSRPANDAISTSSVASLAEMQAQGAPVSLMISRGPSNLIDVKRHITRGPLRVMARSAGDSTVFQVNDSAAATFRDVIPQTPRKGVFGIIWPAGARLVRLQARRLPQLSGAPLEQGDQLFGERRYKEALQAYESQWRQSGASEAGQQSRREARFKSGLCLLRLARTEEALRDFDGVASESALPGEPWPLVALSQIWQYHLSRGDFQEASNAFSRLTASYTAEEITKFISESDRDRIVTAYERLSKGAAMLLPDQKAIEFLKRAVEISQSLQLDTERQIRLLQRLFYCQRLSRDDSAAYQTYRQALPLLESLPVTQTTLYSDFIVDICWLLRSRGESALALAELQRWTATMREGQNLDAYREVELMLEQARILIAARRTSEALSILDQAHERIMQKSRTSSETMATFRDLFAMECLIRGALALDNGDSAGALQQWKRGTYLGWLRENAVTAVPDKRDPIGLGQGGGWFTRLHTLALTGVSSELGQNGGQRLLEELLKTFGNRVGPAAIMRLLNIPPTLLGDMWRTPRGMRALRSIALRDLTYAEFMRMPGVLMTFEIARRGAFPEKISAEEDVLLWNLMQGAIDAYITRSIKESDVVPLLLAWKGDKPLFGLQLSPSKLPASIPANVRCPAAYVFGKRFQLTFKDSQKAALYFTQARNESPADSMLRKLAESALADIAAAAGKK